MKRKNILYVEFLKVTAANHLLMMMKGLKAATNYRLVALCQKDSYLSRELRKLHIPVYEIEHTELNLHDPTTYLPFIRLTIRMIDIIIRHKVGIIHCHRLNWAYACVIPSLLLRVPLFVQIVIIEKLTSKFQNFLIRHHRGIRYICVSKSAMEDFRAIYPVKRAAISYHYGGLYFPDLRTAKLRNIPILEQMKKKTRIVGMISRMDPLKGVDVFIESAAILHRKHPDVSFVHIGNHPEYVFQDGYYEHNIQRVNNLGLDSVFHFIDYLDDILPYYRYFDLMALPTSKDTLSYVNLEANAYGVPVVFTDIGGVAETSKPEFGLSIPFPASPVLLADKLDGLLSNTNRRVLLKRKIAGHMRTVFDARKNASGLARLYEDVS